MDRVGKDEKYKKQLKHCLINNHLHPDMSFFKADNKVFFKCHIIGHSAISIDFYESSPRLSNVMKHLSVIDHPPSSTYNTMRYFLEQNAKKMLPPEPTEPEQKQITDMFYPLPGSDLTEATHLFL